MREREIQHMLDRSARWREQETALYVYVKKDKECVFVFCIGWIRVDEEKRERKSRKKGNTNTRAVASLGSL